MVVFVFVMCILLTFGCTVSLLDGFRKRTVPMEARILTFLISMGLAIWGWLIYF